jgi:hypothetical protein
VGLLPQPFVPSGGAGRGRYPHDWGIEELGQACITDYVQSTETGLKRAMLQRSVDGYERLQTLRPKDSAIELRKLFCLGRLRIAQAPAG